MCNYCYDEPATHHGENRYGERVQICDYCYSDFGLVSTAPRA